MPVSAYVQSAIFLILAAVALFAAAGTLAILGFWLYLAILATIVVAAASAGAWYPAFGEAEQGFAAPSPSTSLR
jgi:hypothetical protein